VAAKLRHRERTVVCFAGDGCFLMHGQEFMTAVMYRAPIIVLVVNNGLFGTIRMHQEREYPGRVSGTSMANPDFAALARAFGGHGETVMATAEFEPAWSRAVESGLPAILDIVMDPEALTVRDRGGWQPWLARVHPVLRVCAVCCAAPGERNVPNPDAQERRSSTPMNQRCFASLLCVIYPLTTAARMQLSQRSPP
jgi:TPP-dependent trihydroxycyclohexane-1,2-dione (THcHDO) dehydratase